jgi:hypothetical protein
MTFWAQRENHAHNDRSTVVNGDHIVGSCRSAGQDVTMIFQLAMSSRRETRIGCRSSGDNCSIS